MPDKKKSRRTSTHKQAGVDPALPPGSLEDLPVPAFQDLSDAEVRAALANLTEGALELGVDPSVLAGQPLEPVSLGLEEDDFAPSAPDEFKPPGPITEADFLHDPDVLKALDVAAGSQLHSPSIVQIQDGNFLLITPHNNTQVVTVHVLGKYFFLGQIDIVKINEVVAKFINFINDFSNFIAQQDPSAFVQNYQLHSSTFLQNYPHHKKYFDVYHRNILHPDKVQAVVDHQMQILQPTVAAGAGAAASAGAAARRKRPRGG
jgi:hypothetical protein